MAATTIRRLTGVYNASGGLLGELRYVAGKLRGTAHCELCDLTHAGVRRRGEWRELVATLPVPFDVVHRSERAAAAESASGAATPCLLAHTDDGVVTVMAATDFAGLDGDVAAFAARLDERRHALGLRWPEEPATG